MERFIYLLMKYMEEVWMENTLQGYIIFFGMV